jgi:hypothetical protein
LLDTGEKFLSTPQWSRPRTGRMTGAGNGAVRFTD